MALTLTLKHKDGTAGVSVPINPASPPALLELTVRITGTPPPETSPYTLTETSTPKILDSATFPSPAHGASPATVRIRRQLLDRIRGRHVLTVRGVSEGNDVSGSLELFVGSKPHPNMIGG